MDTNRQRASLRLCSRTFYAFALKPEPPLGEWMEELDKWLARSPDFFAGKAIVLDVSQLDLSGSELTGLVSELDARNIRILGLDGADPSEAGTDLPGLLVTEGVPDGDEPADKGEKTAQGPTTLLIDSPVRSGQSIVNHDGDVVVIGSVASAAEIIAVGSIHVYGTLRGRAMAGAFGNTQARIFCRRLEAELIAIDGNYLLADDLEPDLRGKAVQARLNGMVLEVALQD
jgi:septum site-determining protein MinC